MYFFNDNIKFACSQSSMRALEEKPRDPAVLAGFIANYISAKTSKQKSELSNLICYEYSKSLYKNILVVPDFAFRNGNPYLTIQDSCQVDCHYTCIPLTVFLNPSKHSWFMSKDVQKVKFLDQCFMKRFGQEIQHFVDKLNKQHKVKFGSAKYVHQCLLDLNNNSSGFTNSRAYTFPAIKLLYPSMRSFEFDQIAHSVAYDPTCSKVSAIKPETVSSAFDYRSVSFEPSAEFLGCMNSMSLQLTSLSALKSLENYHEIKSLGLFLCSSEYYKFIKCGKSSNKFTEENLHELLLALFKMTNLEEFTFYPPIGITNEQYSRIVNYLLRLKHLKKVDTGHYFAQLSTTLGVLKDIPATIESCKASLLIVDSKNTKCSLPGVSLPAVKSFELYRVDSTDNAPIDIYKTLTGFRFPNLCHFTDKTGFLGARNKFFLDNKTMQKLVTYNASIGPLSHHSCSTIMSLLTNDDGFKSLKSCKQLSLNDYLFTGVENKQFRKQKAYTTYRQLQKEISLFYKLVNNGLIDAIKFVGLSNKKNTNAQNCYNIDYFDSFYIDNAVDVLDNSLIPKEILLDLVADPKSILESHFNNKEWTLAKVDLNILDENQKEALDYIHPIIVKHSFWDMVFKALASLDNLEFVQLDRFDVFEGMPYRFIQHGQRTNFLDMPELQKLAKSNPRLKQICVPEYELYQNKNTLEEYKSQEEKTQNGLELYALRSIKQQSRMHIFGQKTATHEKSLCKVVDVVAYRGKAAECLIRAKRGLHGLEAMKVIAKTKANILSRHKYESEYENDGFGGWL